MTTGTRGVLVSIASSIGFAAIYFATPLLAPLPAESVWAIRVLLALPFVTAVLLATRSTALITEIGTRIARRPALAAGVVLSATLLSVQLWLFGWAPLNGRGLQVALGYFLLPLVLVLIGRFLYRDRMTWWQWAAAGAAAAGVGYELVRVGGVGWETLLVVFGYPGYFVLRRRLRISHLGGMWWEMAVAFPAAAVLLSVEAVTGSAFARNPALWWSTIAFGLFAALALLLYLIALRLLPLSLFGLLSYVEPALLVVASLLIGERIGAAEWPAYLAIWTAVTILFAGGAVEALHSRRRGGMPQIPLGGVG